jgi:6-phosphogluconolactonase
MPGFDIRMAEDAAQTAREGADEFVRLARAVIHERGRFVVALAGGSTPRRMYQLLAEAPYRDRVEWPRVEFVWGDERSVPPDHEESNYRMAWEALLSRVPVEEGRLHRLRGEAADGEQTARQYQQEIAGVFGVPPDGDPPELDLILLGMGTDGHTASLFPHTAALGEPTRWVVSNDVPQLKTRRLTLTEVILNCARRVVFLVAGADKAGILAEVLEGPFKPNQLPSQRIHPASGPPLWIVDRAAAAQLQIAKSGEDP